MQISMKGLFILCFATAVMLPGRWLPAAEPSLAAQIATEVDRLRPELEPRFRDHPQGELEKAVLTRARGTVARRLFAEGVNSGDTNKLNEAVKLDEAVGKPAYLQSAAIKGLPPIHEAVEKGNVAVVAWLLERKSPLDFTVGTILEDRDYRQYRRHLWQQPLQVAARNLRLDLMRMLLQAGASPTPATSPSDSPSPAKLLLEPFHVYRRFPDDADLRVEAIQLLLQHGANLFVGQHPGHSFSPLGYAIQAGRADLLDGLLTNSRPLTIQDASGNTLLHYAAALGRTNAAAVLLAAKVSIQIENDQGATPFQVAEFGLPRPYPFGSGSNRPDLLTISPTQKNRIVEQLLAAGAKWDPFTHIKLGRTNDLAALLKERPTLVHDRLLNQGTPLHFAAQHGQIGAVHLLLHVAPVDAVDGLGRTPFWCAIEKGHVEAARLLLEAGADINTRDRNGVTALLWRIQYGGEAIPEPVPVPGFSRMGGLAATLPPELRPVTKMPALNPLLFLLENRADPSATNLAGRTSLHELLDTNHYIQHAHASVVSRNIARTVDLLLNYGAKLEATDTNGATPLHRAAQRGILMHASALIARGANLEAQDRQGRTPVMLAAKANFVEISNYLITAGADPLARDADGNTVLHHLCATLPGTVTLPTNLVSHAKFQALTQITNRFGSPPFHLALLNATVLNPPPTGPPTTNQPPPQIALLDQLIRTCPSLDFIGTNGQTYAHLIAVSTTAPAFTHIESALNRVIPLRRELLDRADRDGNSALHLAAAHNHLPLATLLLARGANLNLTNRDGNTALHLAVTRNQLNVTELLLTRGANPNLTNHAGQTPLLLGYLHFLGHKFPPGAPFDPLGRLLVKHGARLNLADMDGRTPLQIAAADFRGVPASLRPEGATRDLFKALDEGDAASLRAWLRADASLIRVRRHQHEGFPTLLQEAAQRQPKDFGPVFREAVGQPEAFHALAFGWADILRAVLRTNAGFAKEEIQGRPALHWAAGSGNVETVRALLDAHADVQATDAASLTALPAARARESRAIVELLLARGLRPTVFDCLASDDLASLSELLQRDKTLATVKNRQGQPALLVAVAAGKLPLAELLLASGADANQGCVFNPPPGAPGAVVVGWFVGGPADRPLPAAVAAGNLPMTQLLLRHGAEVNQALPTRFTLLHQAVAAGNVALAALLLEHGADVNAQHLPAGEAKPAAPLAGDTPLHTAARTGRTNVMHLLLQHGARLEATNALGQTPLGAVLYPTLDAPAVGEIAQAMSGFGIVRMGGFRPVTPAFPSARPTADFLRQQGAKRAAPPTKGSWREALDPQKVHHPAGPLPATGTPL